MTLRLATTLLISLILLGCSPPKQAQESNLNGPIKGESKINGLTLVAPPKPPDSSWTKSPQSFASHVAIVPYAFCAHKSTQISYDSKRQWWGERSDGVIACIEKAHDAGLKTMLKPQIWFGSGWAGDHQLDNAKDWTAWEKSYRDYLLSMCEIATQHNVDVFCIGTELKHSFNDRAQFWKDLIAQIRITYSGKITIAANWDNFENISFWSELDYIGVDAYFPLIHKNNPTTQEIIEAWEDPASKLTSLSKKHNKQVLFCEYGYRSIVETTWNNWEKDDSNSFEQCEDCQSKAFEALLHTFWDKPWFAGGFIWKWYIDQSPYHGNLKKDYTPQGKPSLEIIQEYYRAH